MGSARLEESGISEQADEARGENVYRAGDQQLNPLNSGRRQSEATQNTHVDRGGRQAEEGARRLPAEGSQLRIAGE